MNKKSDPAKGIREQASALRKLSKQQADEIAAAELLAAIEDGTLTLDLVPEEILENCIRTVGIEAVTKVFVERQVNQTQLEGPTSAASIARIHSTRPAKHTRLETAEIPLLDVTAHSPWGTHAFAQEMPDFGRVAATLGAGEKDFTRWRLSTVIIRSESGWGSGAVISPDGWILTNYRLIEGAAQAAATTGDKAKVEVIRAQVKRGQLNPKTAHEATLYRADPVRDLALLKLNRISGELPCFSLGKDVRQGEACFVIGSQAGGPAWWLRRGNVLRQFEFRGELNPPSSGKYAYFSRCLYTATVTDVSVSSGDSGGPLVNVKGELIGLTAGSDARDSSGEGQHISAQDLAAFVGKLPGLPEGIPFDMWTAGVREAVLLEPQLAEADNDSRTDLLTFSLRAPTFTLPTLSQLVAQTIYVDLVHKSRTTDLLERVPFGLWGLGIHGNYRFSFSVTTRADGLVAIGCTGGDGFVDEIRVGKRRHEWATLIWRFQSGVWRADTAPVMLPLMDWARFQDDTSRVRRIVNRLIG